MQAIWPGPRVNKPQIQTPALVMDGWTQRNAVGRREQTVITQSFCCHPPSFFPLPPEVLSAVPVSSTPRAVDRVAGTLGTGEAPSRSFSLPLTTLLQPPAPLQVHSGPPPLLSSLSGKFPPQISSLAPPLPWISVQMSPYQMPPSPTTQRKGEALLPDLLHFPPLALLFFFIIFITTWQFTCLFLYFLCF